MSVINWSPMNFTKMIKLLILILTLTTMSNAQVPFFGKCPAVTIMNPFNVSQYVGTWYENQKYFAKFELFGKCITATYTLLANGNLKVYNSQINTQVNQERHIEGTATLAGAPNEGKLSVFFPSVPYPRPAPYWVLDTDYTNYTVVYSCSDFFIFNTKFIWILTRERNPSASVLEAAYSVMDRNRLKRSFLMKTDQSSCP